MVKRKGQSGADGLRQQAIAEQQNQQPVEKENMESVVRLLLTLAVVLVGAVVFVRWHKATMAANEAAFTKEVHRRESESVLSAKYQERLDRFLAEPDSKDAEHLPSPSAAQDAAFWLNYFRVMSKMVYDTHYRVDPEVVRIQEEALERIKVKLKDAKVDLTNLEPNGKEEEISSRTTD